MYVTKTHQILRKVTTYKNKMKLMETSAPFVPNKRTNKRAMRFRTKNQKQVTSLQFHGSQREDGFLQRKEF
jgi:hypothetical protein